MDIPVIDISGFESGDRARRAAIAAEWGRAFETVGFASIVGHGIPEDRLDGVYAKARQFFDQPLDTKMRWKGEGGHGYSPKESEAVGRSEAGADALPPDLSEAIQFWDLHRGGKPDNIWPDTPADFRSVMEEYVALAAALERRLMRICALALALPEDYFEPHYNVMSTKLRLVEYPDQAAEPLPGQLRNAAHTDFGGFTILRQDDAPGGLQVKAPDGEWIDVRPIPGSLVINAGDLIQRWTNDHWRSNMHRVINPPRTLTGSTRRLSIVVFTGPNHDTMVSCLPTCRGPNGEEKYPPINATEHVRERVRLSYL